MTRSLNHRKDIKVSLISISQLPIELVPRQHRGSWLIRLIRFFASFIVIPFPRMLLETAQHFISTRVGMKVFGITWAAKLLVLPSLPEEAATVLAALPLCLFFQRQSLQSFDM